MHTVFIQDFVLKHSECKCDTMAANSFALRVCVCVCVCVCVGMMQYFDRTASEKC